ncbi:VOC family protein [Streptomyces sp. H27-D2]|uniref:VOC family protein n=1 Tax=Streptomyces sp. H27-D2 TaxID=3046304 RepID=UPI002DBDD04D|nr:VOC family protein [Streptomyces sp. H27-D2]MEC4019201.1 VOC family protein [Streptomyces sp. H27-D2]
MPAKLDHTIVHSTDRFVAARFLTDLLDAPEAKPNGPFAAVPLGNGVTIDYADSVVTPDRIVFQHLAMLVSEEEFDGIFERIGKAELPYWAGPGHRGRNEINHRLGGRGVYVDDPDGVAIEFLTRTEGEA